MNSKNNFYVITGGPGVGKTTLLKELNKVGYLTIPEDARQIIKQQQQNNGKGLPWKDKELYGELMLSASIKTYQDIKAQQLAQPIFFDRGILDTLCYYKMENLSIPKDVNDLIQKYSYNQTVFILPPWKEIYETDTERKQTWKEAELTFEKMQETYKLYGYNSVEVPKESIENRRKFILEQIA